MTLRYQWPSFTSRGLKISSQDHSFSLPLVDINMLLTLLAFVYFASAMSH